MLTATQPHSHFVDEHRMAICADCHEKPDNRHFTTVPHEIHNYGWNTAQLFNDAICDACFLRRRLEGKL